MAASVSTSFISGTLECYDILIAGAGATGCIVAARVAEADPSLKILVIEAGPDVRDDAAHYQAGRTFHHLHPASKTVKFYAVEPSPHLDNRQAFYLHGQCVGGGSSMNLTMYTRAAASDYDDWKTVYGAEGWGFADLLPYLKKCENYTLDTPTPEVHGRNGPLVVSHGGEYTTVGKEWLEVAPKYDGRPVLEDPNDFYTVNGYSRWRKWINSDTGRRSDSAHNYLYPQQDRNTNLHLLTGCVVDKIIFEGTRAAGVEFAQNGRKRVIKASRQVVISSGAFGTPGILERSGLGDRSVLQTAGVNVVSDLPGVGENLIDHHVIFFPYNTPQDHITFDSMSRGEPEAMEYWSEIYNKEKRGILSSNPVDAGIKMRASPEELKAIGPEFTKRWDSYYAEAPDKSMLYMGCSVTSCHAQRETFTVLASFRQNHPESIGKIHITSSDPSTPQKFEPMWMSEPADMELLVWAYKHSRETARRMPCYRGEFKPNHPEFAQGSDAYIKDVEMGPVPIDAPPIVYTKEDNEAIRTAIKKFISGCWHTMGSAAMKPRDKNGVVDPRLNVYGTEHLKVADLSICPANVGANPYSTCTAIGEKAAVLICEDLGIELAL
ncbi:alcohol oxidase-like protein [Stereum hirsutum FP-91666 SS1]|uniref:Alcohol oxidase-like protein n=1 Tax=Stereum hirsutum (strain FP-91666) TaxID=721885 RepID=R7RYW2_STEHR|nr:alcohol oxidase-like protein [Stereum hirsutum FP-91666 SS1]EIM80090.1 alcohol oxidase-like protein [Stereum hirsutum FP-91666 SS1]